MRIQEEWLNIHKKEMEEQLIKKIFKNKQMIIFELQNNCFLHFSLNPHAPLIFLSQNFQDGEVYSKFNDYLSYCQISDVNIHPKDQIIIFSIKKAELTGNIKELTLIFEEIPKFTNLILVEKKTIKFAYDYFNKKDNSYRQILIGQEYQFPPPPREVKDSRLLEKIKSLSISADIDLNKSIQIEYKKLTENNQVESRQNELKKNISAIIKRKKKLLSNLKQESHQQEKQEKYQYWGLLLQSNFHLYQEGMEKISLYDYVNDKEIEIPLRKELNASENAEFFFKKYKKMKKAENLIHLKITQIEKELKELMEKYNSIDNYSEEQLKKAAKEIFEKNSRISDSQQRLPYHEGITREGKTVLIGKNSSDNDQLTFKIAKPHDYWFHARDMKGSHVIIKMPDKKSQLTNKDIEDAASAAAYFSKGKNSGLVPVDYTLKKYVRKPKNAPPGFVLFEREKTIMIKPAKTCFEEEKNDMS